MSNPYADHVFRFVDAAHEAPSVGELNRKFGELVSGWGFDHWACIQISVRPGAIMYPLARHFGEPDEAWMARYKEAGHVHNDVAAQEVVIRMTGFWWSDLLRERTLTREASRVFEEARDFDLNEGFAVPVRFPDGSVWSCVMSGAQVEKNRHVAEAASLAAQFYAGRGAHLRSVAKTHRDVLSFRLTKRQRQIVEGLRFGKTQQEIARIYGLSVSTVHNELAEARRRLGVATAAELVAEALLNGEIGLGPEH